MSAKALLVTFFIDNILFRKTPLQSAFKMECCDVFRPQNMIIRYYYNVIRKNFFKKTVQYLLKCHFYVVTPTSSLSMHGLPGGW